MLRKKNNHQFKQTNFRAQAACTLLAQHIFDNRQHTAQHIYSDDGKRQTLSELLTGNNKEIWQKSTSNEFGHVAQGIKHGVIGQDVINFIHKHKCPQEAKVTYASFVCDYRPLKNEKHRVRMVVGGDRLTYDDDAGSPAVSLLETKLLINSTISTPGARFACADLKDHFLQSPMAKPEYMKIHISSFPDDIIEQYKLQEKVTNNGFVYVRIKKGMYGLKQAAILAYEFIVENLAPHGYHPIPQSLGLWRHETRPIQFCLCVDDFGIKYERKEDLDHLLNALRQKYEVSVDMTGSNFCGLTFEWDYKQSFVDVSMPKYIPKTLKNSNTKRQ